MLSFKRKFPSKEILFLARSYFPTYEIFNRSLEGAHQYNRATARVKRIARLFGQGDRTNPRFFKHRTTFFEFSRLYSTKAFSINKAAAIFNAHTGKPVEPTVVQEKKDSKPATVIPIAPNR